MMTSFSTGGRPSSSNFGMSVVMVRSTMPTRPCCTNALTRKRPMPGGLIAKLHSLRRLELGRLLVVHHAAHELDACAAARARVFDTGVILPSTLIAGGKPAVMKRSEPFCLTSRSSSSWMNLVALFAFHGVSLPAGPGSRRWRSRAAEEVLVDGAVARFATLTLSCASRGPSGSGRASACRSPALVWIAEYICATLSSRIRLRMAGRADHDLVRRDAALAVLGLQQRLRDHRTRATPTASRAPFPFRRRGTRR